MNSLITFQESFGPPEVLKFKEEPCRRPKAKEFLVRGQFATVSTGDIRIRASKVPRGFGLIMGLLFGFRTPKFESLGTDYVGQVVQVGSGIRDLKIGDRVVVDLGMRLGGHRSHRVVSEKEIWAAIPDRVSSDHAAAAVFGGLTALLFLRDKLKVRPGERVLVIGAGGAVGSSAVQLARALRASVVGVCSEAKVQVVTDLGADQVLSYEREGWAEQVKDLDVVLDCVGTLDTISARAFVRPGGRVGFVVADLMLNLKFVLYSIIGGTRFVAGAIQSQKPDLDILMQLIDEGRFKPLIGKRFVFSEIVRAHREVESGHRLGSTLIEFGA